MYPQVRKAALECLQTLARYDAKSLHQMWLRLLPVASLFSARRADVTLIDVLVKDPNSKVKPTGRQEQQSVFLIYNSSKVVANPSHCSNIQACLFNFLACNGEPLQPFLHSAVIMAMTARR